MNFEPEDYIGEEDAEDQMYMREYNIQNEVDVKLDNRRKLEKWAQGYGENHKKRTTYHLSHEPKSRYKDYLSKSLNNDNYDVIRKKTYNRGGEIARQSQLKDREALDMIQRNRSRPVNKSLAY